MSPYREVQEAARDFRRRTTERLQGLDDMLVGMVDSLSGPELGTLWQWCLRDCTMGAANDPAGITTQNITSLLHHSTLRFGSRTVRS